MRDLYLSVSAQGPPAYTVHWYQDQPKKGISIFHHNTSTVFIMLLNNNLCLMMTFRIHIHRNTSDKLPPYSYHLSKRLMIRSKRILTKFEP